MRNIKLIALDLDDTLLTSKKKVGFVDKLWVKKAKKAGIKVAFATGRSFQRTERYWIELELDPPLILVNGAEVWRKPGDLLTRQFLSRNEVYKLITRARDHNFYYWAYGVGITVTTKDWTEDMFEKDWMKIGMRHQDLTVVNLLREELKSRDVLNITFAQPTNIEAMARGASKLSGVERVCTHLGISMENVMAVGNSHNDLALLKAAGLGIAVKNADQAVKNVADGVTDSNDEFGVAKSICRYVFQIDKL